MKGIIDITKRELREYLFNPYFWLVFVLLLLVMVIMLFILLPFQGERSLETGWVAPVYANLLAFSVAFISLFLTDGVIKFSEMFSDGYWFSRKGYSPQIVYTAKTLATLIINLIVIATYYPLGLLVLATGGFSFSSLHYLFVFLLLITLTFSWLGLFIRRIFRHERRSPVSIFLRFAYLVSIIVFYNLNNNHNIYLNKNYIIISFGIGFILYLGLAFNIFNLSFKKTGDGKYEV